METENRRLLLWISGGPGGKERRNGAFRPSAEERFSPLGCDDPGRLRATCGRVALQRCGHRRGARDRSHHCGRRRDAGRRPHRRRHSRTSAWRAGEPGFEVVRAVSTAWADASLRFLHAVSCEDPLTGLASLAHLRSKMLENYREQTRRGETTPRTRWSSSSSTRLGPGLALRPGLRLVDVAECMRRCYDGDETIGRLTVSRAAAVVRRDDRLGSSVTALRGLLTDWHDEGGVATRSGSRGCPRRPSPPTSSWTSWLASRTRAETRSRRAADSLHSGRPELARCRRV